MQPSAHAHGQDTPWVSESRGLNVIKRGLGLFVVGAALSFFSWMAHKSHEDGAFVMLPVALGACGYGLYLLLGQPQETTVVDSKLKRIVIERTSRFSQSRRMVAFSQIERLLIVGDGEDERFHISAKLTDGSTTTLFDHHYDGQGERREVEWRRQRLSALILHAFPAKASTLLVEPPGFFARLRGG